ELTIDWVYMRALWDKRDGNKPVPIEFQSDDPEKQPEKFKHILATVGKPRATIRFSKTGNPLKVTTPNGKPVSNKTAANDTADGSREAHLIVLPEQPVAIGESWKERYDIVTFDETRNLTKVMFQRVYKLVAVTDGKAIIELKTMILSPGLSPPVLSQFLLAEVAGKITLDINRGLIVSKVLTAQNTVVNAIPGVSSQMKGTLHYTEKLTGEEQAATRAAASADVNSKK
ncbi:MAG: hypothetical protein JSS02_13080, partial [Planctomycetes bacterium]|nr:hypothetical protein [Planctomycetota bacterium]